MPKPPLLITLALILTFFLTFPLLSQAFAQDPNSQDSTTSGLIEELLNPQSSQETTQVTYQLLNGWNLVHFPLNPTFSTADGLIDNIKQAGGLVTTVSTWQDNHWQIYVKRYDQSFSADFPIEPGKAYFLRSHLSISWTVTGTALESTPELKLQPGWNAVGTTIPNLTAQTTLDAINSQPPADILEKATQITHWLSGNWQVFVKRLYSEENIQEYGDNFPILPQTGLMIQAHSTTTWQP